MLHLFATGSHLYPGATGTASGQGPEVVIDFADLSRTTATLTGDRLDTLPYETSAGTRVPAKAWHLTLGGGRFRIEGRLPADPDAAPT